MFTKIFWSSIFSLLLTILLFSSAAAASSYQYIRLGEKTDSTAIATAGTALMGGGKDLDAAFRWLCRKATGGDFLVLRARGDDGTFGNMRRNTGEFLNVLNHPNFDSPYTMTTDVLDPVYEINDLGVVRATPDVAASNPVVGSGGSRHIQLGAKLVW